MILPCSVNLTNKRKLFFKKESYSKGFTIIELLVVVGIIIVLSTIGIASYNNFNDKKVLEAAAEELKSNLRLVQSKAINNEKDANFIDCQNYPLDGWYVDFASNEYTCQCNNNQSSNTNSLVDLDVNDDSINDITMNSSSSTFLFKALGGTNLTADNTITLSYKSVSDQIVVISTGGDIN